MGTALGAIGMVGFVGCLIWFIVLLIARKSTSTAKTGLIICAVLFFVGMLTYMVVDHEPKPKEASNSSQSSGQEDIASTSDAPNDTDQSEPDKTEEADKPGPCTLPGGFEITLFYNSVRNDVTGNWRLSAGASSIPISDCALDYYNIMFRSDEEIHAVWNATLGTMTSIKAMSGLLFIDTFEYVDGEEHDAKLLFSGMLLDSQIIDIEAGKPFEP